MFNYSKKCFNLLISDQRSGERANDIIERKIYIPKEKQKASEEGIGNILKEGNDGQ